MKKIVVCLILTAFVGMVYAQTKNCTQPLPTHQFQQKYNQIKSKPNEASRLITAKKIVKTHCFSSAQVKEIAALFENDYDRFDFAKIAYNNTTDKSNFYDVYDAFIYYSVVFRLHDYIQNKETIEENTVVEEEISFPDYNYPPYKLYHGKRNCSGLISEPKFKLAVKNIYQLQNDNEKYTHALRYINNNCLATAHLMKIASLLGTEHLRFSFAKEALNSVYDIDNYIEMKQIFNTPRARSEFINYLRTQTTTENKCQISTQEYQQVINTIKGEAFNSTKLSSAKHLIKTKKCFTSKQIKGIVELFSYENSRLEIAMMAYEFATDQSEYYVTVGAAFGFESSKKKLLDHINKTNQ